MAFMEPEVLDKQEWAEVETNNGTSWVPLDVLSSSEAQSARRGDFEPLLKYTEGTQVYSDQSRIRKGYGVRLSAPGYMDATEWEVYGSKKEALKRARELAREAEGEDYATMKTSRGHATKKSTAQLDREIADVLARPLAQNPYSVHTPEWERDRTVRKLQRQKARAGRAHSTRTAGVPSALTLWEGAHSDVPLHSKFWYPVDQGTYHITPVSNPDQPRDVRYDLRFNKKPLGWEKIGPYHKTLKQAVSAAQKHYAKRR